MKEPSINFESLLEDNDRQFRQAIVELKAMRSEVCTIAADVLGEWFREEAARRVETQIHMSSKLDDNRMREMKKDVNALADRATEIVARHFGEECFEHEVNLAKGKMTDRKPSTDRIEASFRQARCELGPILAKYGFMAGDIARESFVEFSRAKVPSELSVAAVGYVAELRLAENLLERRGDLERQRSSAKEKGRWDAL